ncbi:MAG: hypothetical protein MK137_09505, partial [Rickettsiales bacterium]|nr:hypothetical protein [Rickettsiales bacterium]
IRGFQQGSDIISLVGLGFDSIVEGEATENNELGYTTQGKDTIISDKDGNFSIEISGRSFDLTDNDFMFA